jgi:hypothetical protein
MVYALYLMVNLLRLVYHQCLMHVVILLDYSSFLSFKERSSELYQMCPQLHISIIICTLNKKTCNHCNNV